MANIKISAAADAGTLLGTDMVPMARSGSSTAYHATMAEIQTFTSATAAGGLNNVGRNYADNALFDVEQRGAGPWTTTSSYTADRWVMSFLNGSMSTSISSPVSDANRAAIGDEYANNALQCVVTGSA